MEWILIIVLTSVCVGTAIHLWMKGREGERRRAADQLDRLQRHKQNQNGYRYEMTALADQSADLFVSLPTRLTAASRCLDRADEYFSTRAFLPFWDSIEDAVGALGQFDEGIDRIRSNASRYAELVRVYEEEPSKFPVELDAVGRLKAATSITRRMQSILRKADSDYEFTKIYLARKTNAILIAGFTNVVDAVNQAGSLITASIDNLTSTVDSVGSAINDSLHAIDARMERDMGRITEHGRELSRLESERAERVRRATQMLDNIQRGIRPFP